MDPFTHGVLGATVAVLADKKRFYKYAAFAGAAGAMSPDLDMFIRKHGDPLLTFVYHRHFTHSLLFSPLGSLIVAVLIWPFLHKHIKLLHIWMLCLLGYVTHPLLDSCTSYGTHMFWPFTNSRTAWDFISIIDPIYSLILLVGLLITLSLKNWKPAMFALVLSIFYMGIGAIQHERAVTVMRGLAAERGHRIEHWRVTPTFANLVVWHIVYKYDGMLYIDGVRVGRGVKVFHGGAVKAFEPQMIKAPPGSELERDINIFYFFADEMVGLIDGEKNVLGDYRYTDLPQDTRPFWGLRFYPDKPDIHSDFIGISRTGKKLPSLWHMIKGS